MNEDNYVFDTYALIEIIEGNPKYRKYVDTKMVITEFILAEVCLAVLRRYQREMAFRYVDKCAPFVVQVKGEVIKNAMEYRLRMNKRDVSTTDCVGYCLAKDSRIKFLTGDKEFKNMPWVEFVK